MSNTIRYFNLNTNILTLAVKPNREEAGVGNPDNICLVTNVFHRGSYEPPSRSNWTHKQLDPICPIAIGSYCFPMGPIAIGSNCFPMGPIAIGSHCFPMGPIAIGSNCFPMGPIAIRSNCYWVPLLLEGTVPVFLKKSIATSDSTGWVGVKGAVPPVSLLDPHILAEWISVFQP